MSAIEDLNKILQIKSDIYSICLNGCYLKIDNEVAWSGLTPKIKGIWTKN